MLCFQNERCYQAGNFGKDVFFSHLQPGGDIKSEELLIYDLEFVDVT